MRVKGLICLNRADGFLSLKYTYKHVLCSDLKTGIKFITLFFLQWGIPEPRGSDGVISDDDKEDEAGDGR